MEWDRTPAVPSAVRLEPRTVPEQSLVAAAQRATDRSAARLRRALGGYGLGNLHATDGGVLSLLALDGPFASALASAGLVDRYVATHESNAPYLAAVPGIGANEREAPSTVVVPSAAAAERPSVLPAGLDAELRSGRTFIVHRIDQYDRGALRRFVEDLERVAGVPVGVNCYLSRDGAEGFGRHWDDHDVLVLQVEGRKLWEVYEPSHLSPVRGYVHDDLAGRPAWSGVLEPGQGLFIPRGWSHAVVGLDERSVHHTVGIHRPSLLDVVDSLAWAIDDDPPEPGDAGFRRWLAAQAGDGPALAARAIAAVRAEVPTRPQGTLQATASWLEQPDPRHLEVLSMGPPVFVDRDAGAAAQDGARLRWSGLDVRLEPDEVELLARWDEGLDASEAAGQLGRELLQAGLARVAEDGSP